MSDDDEEVIAAIRRAINAQRGYADFDAWPDPAVRDRSIGEDFAASLEVHCGIRLTGMVDIPRGSDPPDLLANGSIGIELTELVDPAMVKAASRQKRAGTEPFQYRDWPRDDLINWLRKLIERKDRGKPKIKHAFTDYWLVIHTDEPGLTPDLVQAHLAEWPAVPCQLLTRCFLLMSYFPSHSGRPIFELTIDVAK